MPVINPKTGKEFRWAKHRWTPRTRARWHKKTLGGHPVLGSVRGIAHLDWMDRRSRVVFGPHASVEVIQSAFNTGVEASKGTHDFDLVYDLVLMVNGKPVDWWRQQRFFRAHFFDGWYRHPPLFGNHIHGFCMVPWSGDPSKAFAEHGFKVGVYIDGGYSLYGRKVASSQAEDFVHKAFGLAEQHAPGSDHSWFPKDPKKHFDLNAYIARRTKAQASIRVIPPGEVTR